MNTSNNLEAHFHPAPHTEAAALIKNKPPLTRAVFDQLLPELRARAFTIAGVESANVQQRVRDSIATVAEGSTWDDAKDNIIAELDPFLGEGADKRAELLLRTHGFQAFQSAEWRGAQADEDTTHLQYLTMEDERVRESHAALEGIVLPKNDPFWQQHYPPWEWNCRCRTRTINPDQLDEIKEQDEKRAPDSKLVIEGPALKKLRDGHLFREGQTYDVSPSDSPGAFAWDPNDLRIPLADMKPRYDAPVWDAFETMAKKTDIGGNVSLWDYLRGKEDIAPPIVEAKPAPEPEKPVEASEPPKEETVPAGIVQVQAQLKAKKFKKIMIETVGEIPAVIAPIMENLKVDTAGKKGAFYRPTTDTIHIAKDPAKWSGHPQTILHEIGHHVHFESNYITYHHVDPDFKVAMEKDLAIVRDWAKQRHPDKGIEVYAHTYRNMTFIAEDLAKAMGYERYDSITDMEGAKRVARVSDAIMAVSNGEYGAGHALSYMKRYSPMEAFAHAFSVLVQPDEFFKKLFPNILAEVAKKYNL